MLILTVHTATHNKDAIIQELKTLNKKLLNNTQVEIIEEAVNLLDESLHFLSKNNHDAIDFPLTIEEHKDTLEKIKNSHQNQDLDLIQLVSKTIKYTCEKTYKKLLES